MRDYVGEIIAQLNKIYTMPWYLELENRERMKLAEEKYPNAGKILARNKEVKNIHKGERCFILGNGPSLNDIDFGLLENEIVFTVNRLTLHPDFEKLKSNYHVITDEDTFGISGAHMQKGFADYAMTQLKSLVDKGCPQLLVPIKARGVIRRAGLEKKLRVRYLWYGQRSLEDGNHSADFTKPVAKCRSVVVISVLWAVYMGFSEIYLLGCDQTLLRDVIESTLGNSLIDDHAYKGEEKLNEEGYRQYANEKGMTYYIELELAMQKEYKELYLWCRSKGIKLYNLSSKTLIDGIPRRKFEDVI